MIIKATQKYTRQTPRKLRLVANAVKKMPLEQAVKQLGVVERKASLAIMKVLKQALANAINNHNLAFADLSIKSITVGEGPTYKRFNAVSRGRGHQILKRSSHITVELVTKDEVAAKQVEEKAVKQAEVKAEKATQPEKTAPKKVTKKSTK